MTTWLTEEQRRDFDSISHVGAERAILGIAMNNPETLFDISTEIEPDDFTNQANRNIYHIMVSILDNKYANIGKVNTVVIYTIAQNSGIEEEIGGMKYLQAIEKTDAGEENLNYFLSKIRQASIRKKSFMKAITVIEDSISGENDDIDEFVARQEEKFLDIVMETKHSSDAIIRVGDVIDVVLEERENSPKEVLGMSTGFPEYDRAMNGLVPGRLKVVAAPPKTGKSAFALNVAIHNAIREGIPVLYVDSEMQTGEQIDRMVSVVATDILTVPTKIVERGAYINNPKMNKAVTYAKDIIKSAPFYHIYAADLSPDKVFNLARKFQRQYGIEWNGYKGQFLLIYDYIKMPEEDYKNGNRKEYEILGQIANLLKNKIAGQLNIPVLGFAQLNPRTTKDAKDVDSSHMSGSNRIVMAVNELAFLRKKTDEELLSDGEEFGNLVLKVGESRNGGEYEGWIRYDTAKGVPIMKEIRNVRMG